LGRIRASPTNGAAGIVPAVLHYYRDVVDSFSEDGVVRFLLTAAAIGMVQEEWVDLRGGGGLSGRDRGSACSMAAAGLVELLGVKRNAVETARGGLAVNVIEC